MNDKEITEDISGYDDLSSDSDDEARRESHKLKLIVISTLAIFIVINLAFMISYSCLFGHYFESVLKLIPGYRSLIVLFVIFLLCCCLYIFSSCLGIFTLWKSLKIESEDNLDLFHYGLMGGLLLNNLIFPVGIRILQDIVACPCSPAKDPTCKLSNTSLNCYLTPGKMPCPFTHKIKDALGFICALEAMAVIIQLCLYVLRDKIFGINHWKNLEENPLLSIRLTTLTREFKQRTETH